MQPKAKPRDILCETTREVEDFLLARIPFRNSVAVRLRYRSGLTLKDTGIALNVTGDRARQIVERGIFMMRRKLVLFEHAKRLGEDPRDWVRNDYSTISTMHYVSGFYGHRRSPWHA